MVIALRHALLALLLLGLGLALAGCDLCWPRGGQMGVCDQPEPVLPDDDSAEDDDDVVDDDDVIDDDDTGDDDSADDDDVVDDDDVIDDDDVTADPCLEDWQTPLLTTFGHSVVCIPPATWSMGSPPDEVDRDTDELQHTVELTTHLLVDVVEVTQALYEEISERAPSDCAVGCAPDNPVQMVTWLDAIAFCNQLSEEEGLEEVYEINGETVTWLPGLDGYRLLTEAEWEYSARGGISTGPYAGSNHLEEVANCGSEGTTAFGQLMPNGYGLYDMSGNVSEWVWDRYGTYPSTGPGNPDVDPSGPTTGSMRAHRGGSWRGPAADCRVADRELQDAGLAENHRGFRVGRTVQPAKPGG